MKTLQDMAAMKEEWNRKGFIGASVISAYAKMRLQDLDIVFERDNKDVREFVTLLSKYLESGNWQLILMVSTEIEKCIVEEDYEGHRRLLDEIYEHYIRFGEGYPIQAVHLHGDILAAFFAMGMVDEWNNYYNEYCRVLKSMFGEESYLFCRNWCEILLMISQYLPENAYKESEKRKTLFSKYLNEERVLYQICINEAIYQEKINNNPEYLKKALVECKRWMKRCGNNAVVEIENFVKSMEGLYYRHIGEVDKAAEYFLQIIESIDDLNWKVYEYGQLATMFYIKRDKEGLWNCLKMGIEETRKLRIANENVTELYNLMGIYYLLDNCSEMALDWFEKARRTSCELFGRDADYSTKYEANAYLAEFYAGNINKARRGMKGLLEKVGGLPEQYPETYSLVMNNLCAMSMENMMDVQACKDMKRALDGNKTKYDFSTFILYKSNLYLCLVMNDTEQKDIDELQAILEHYYALNPGGEGHEQYLHGKICRYCSQGNMEKAYQIAEKLRNVLKKKGMVGDISCLEFNYAVIQVSVLLYQKKYTDVHKFVTDIGRQYLNPLFVSLSERTEEDFEFIDLMLHSYISLLVSIVTQYPEIGVLPEELYGYVLNYKYLIQLFDLGRKRFKEAVTCVTFSLDGFKIDKKAFVLEYFEYTRYDMENGLKTLAKKKMDMEKDIYQIVFGVSETIEVFYNRNVSEIGMESFGNSEVITTYEKEMCKFLIPRLYGKERIYVCEYGIGPPIPLAAMRLKENIFLGSLFQIIYCNTGWNVKEDIEIICPKDSIFMGTSNFCGLNQMKKKGIDVYFNELPYVQEEIKYAIEYTGGRVISGEMIKEEIREVRCEIIHLASHAVIDNMTGESLMLLEKQREDNSKVLLASDIAEMDWKQVKLVVLSGCNTGSGDWRWAVSKAGALASITTYQEVDDDVNMFFMTYFYRYLVETRRIGEALFKTQKKMISVTKQELLIEPVFTDLNLSFYLQNYEDEDCPFARESAWAVYLYHMN